MFVEVGGIVAAPEFIAPAEAAGVDVGVDIWVETEGEDVEELESCVEDDESLVVDVIVTPAAFDSGFARTLKPREKLPFFLIVFFEKSTVGFSLNSSQAN